MAKYILLEVISAAIEVLVHLTNSHMSFIAPLGACFWFYLFFYHCPQLEPPESLDFRISIRFQNEIIPR